MKRQERNTRSPPESGQARARRKRSNGYQQAEVSHDFLTNWQDNTGL